MTFRVRDYWKYPSRYETVAAWWDEKKKGIFPENMLPPVGVIVEKDGEPIAALWMYMSVGIGEARLEWPITKPGAGIAGAYALREAVNAMKTIAKAHDYGVLRVFTTPKIASALKRIGWKLEDDEPKIPLILRL